MEICKYYKSTGTPFGNLIVTDNLQMWKDRVFERKLASVLLIDGGLGKGKTTLAVQCASFLNGKPIDFKYQLALGGDQLLEKLLICHEKGLHVIVYDEAGDFNRRGALTKFNAQLNRVFEVCRAFKIIIVMVMPCIKTLDNDLFNNGIVRGLFHVGDKFRTHNVVWAYSVYRAHYLLQSLKDGKRNPVVGKAYVKTRPNFKFRCKDLSSKRSIQLEGFSTNSKLDVLHKSVTQLEGLKDVKAISKQIGMSVEWINKACKKHKVIPTKRYKNKRFFNEQQIEEFKGYIKNKVTSDSSIRVGY